MSSKKITNEQITLFEKQESAYWGDYFKSATPEVHEKLGLRFLQVGSGTVTITSRVDILAFNRVIGLGIEKPASENEIEEIIRIYRLAKIPRFFIQLSPNARPGNLSEMLQTKGMYHYNNWVKWFREIELLPASESKLRVEQIGKEKADAFADIIITAFEWPEVLKPVLKVVVGRRGWKHYLVFDEDEPAGCGALFIREENATLAFAATLPEHRGKGAQSALIARRFQDAAKAGCGWMITETAEQTPERSVASYRNMRRHDFEIAYKRPNYILNFST